MRHSLLLLLFFRLGRKIVRNVATMVTTGEVPAAAATTTTTPEVEATTELTEFVKTLQDTVSIKPPCAGTSLYYLLA